MPHTGTLASPLLAGSPPVPPAGGISEGGNNRQLHVAPAKTTAEVVEEFERFKAHLSTYLKPEEVERIADAFAFSQAAHEGQLRSSGDPYISHPLAVAESLSHWHLDVQALCAALLHDVMEDTGVTKEELAERFGQATAELVDGVSKLEKVEHQTWQEAQAENFRKMLLAMARDVRVILIKLADRLHNLKTLDAVRPDKRRRVARETLEIYAPIANRLGLNQLYRELQEISFSHLYPARYRVLGRAVKAARGNRREVVGKILEAVKAKLPENGIEADVMGREKHVYGIYRKMREKHLSFSQVLDIYGFRIIVDDIPKCYLSLGLLHGLFKPVPGKFKDYIAIPKANGYQSLHTTVIGPYGTPVEMQIRTRQMHHVAEAGVASHWLYKDEGETSEIHQKTHKWLQSLLEIQSTSMDSAEFLEHVKVDLFPGEVYCFTPNGKILVLPRGATAVDFAYAVHTDIGHRCVACRINFELMPLRTELSDGDRVEIVTAVNANPNPAWLSYVKSGRARSKIRHFLKTQQTEESAALGERLLTQALRHFGFVLAEVATTQWDKLLRVTGAKSKKDVLTEVGLGKQLPAIVARRLAEGLEAKEEAAIMPGSAPQRPSSTIVIRGTEGMAVQLARCCRPIPGDPIVGIIRKGQGLVVHTHDCKTIAKSRGDRDGWVDVEWQPAADRLFQVAIRIVAENRRGVLAKVSAEISNNNSDIQNVSIEEESGMYSALHFTLQVIDRQHLARIMRGLRRLPEVVRIQRARE
ncbi:MAG TPA: bifunctional (p)ppGpp synthetase/guanosine-3',5'-bis(diphosphate) 3'-pyrophosphohydrolase [Rhodocyclaceae bacterium]|nr:bifunctional (p)ppGpp synthetase/guanosine-3',5'-bis(diphosphate) 3'-pyrophosphohydrolase [Rhodocyclaceae bacterium]